MKRTEIDCDLCGKNMTREAVFAIVGPVIKGQTNITSEFTLSSADVCEACRKRIREWLKTVPNFAEAKE